METNLRTIRVNNILNALNMVFCAVNCSLDALEKDSKKEGAQYCKIRKECNKCFIRYNNAYKRFKAIINSCKGIEINNKALEICESNTEIFNRYKNYFS